MELIPNWHKKNLECYFCGNTKSVKYTMKIKTHPENIKLKEVCVCNKCVLIHNDKEMKGDFDIEKNICKGCIYDLTDRTETNIENFNTILDNCCSCKRCKLEEFQDDFPDLYTATEA